MYSHEYISRFNEAKASYDVYYRAVGHVRGESSGFSDKAVFDKTDKCAIHSFDDGLVLSAECDGVKGVHPSIRSLRDADSFHHCHAEEGARVVDADLAQRAARLSVRDIDESQTAKFQRRYMQGGSVHWSIYGAGYCYLTPLIIGARHRVARILGFCPTVVDWLRFLLLVGDWSNNGFMIVGSGPMIHVVGADWSPKTSMRALLEHLLKLPPATRVGITIRERLMPANPELNLDSAVETDSVFGVYEDPRRDALAGWVANLGVFGVSRQFLDCLYIATSGGASIFPAGGDALRSRVKLWQILGDVKAKEYAVYSALAENSNSERYTEILGSHKNVEMSRLLSTGGFDDICDISFLSKDSKARANVLEAVIGVFALMASDCDLLLCLRYFNLVPQIIVPQEQVMKSYLIQSGLTSSQWKRVMAMKLNGSLGE